MHDQVIPRTIRQAVNRAISEYGVIPEIVDLRAVRRFARRALVVQHATVATLSIALPFSSLMPAALVNRWGEAPYLYLASEVVQAANDPHPRGDLGKAAQLLPEAIMAMIEAAFLPRKGAEVTEIGSPQPGPCVVILCIENGEATLCCAWLRRYRAA